MPRITHKQAEEAFVREQGDLIRKLASGYRKAWHELSKDIPDLNRVKDILDEHYIGGRGAISKAMDGPYKLR